MTISHIGSQNLSLYITESDLKEHNIDIDCFGQKEALLFLQQALEDSNTDTWKAAQVEIYPGKNSLLLFARRKTGNPSHFFFSSLENLIQVAHQAKGPIPACLYQSQGGYLLSVSPFEGDTLPYLFTEFATNLTEEHFFHLHLKEQGSLIFPDFALCQIKEHFPLSS